jgi:hypothetical protein
MKEFLGAADKPHASHHPEELLDGSVAFESEIVAALNQRVENGEPLDTQCALNDVVKHFSEPCVIDPYKAVKHMALSSPVGILLGADTGVKEGYLLHEHTQAVLDGHETDYRRGCTDPTDTKVIRTTLLLQDIAKPLWAADGKRTEGQAEYNVPVASNILDTVDDALLSPEEKTLITILIAEDVMGPAMKNVTLRTPDGSGISLGEAARRVAMLQELCPPSQRSRLARVLPTVYLSDVTAYTSHRFYSVPGERAPVRCQKSLINKLFFPDETGALQFFQPNHMAVMDSLRAMLAHYK